VILRWLLRVAALYLGVLGAASLFIPRAASSGLGRTMTGFDVFAARTIGAILLTVAILNWSTSRNPSAGVVLANLFMNAALATVDITNIVGGTIGASSWTGVIIHLIFVVAFGVSLARAVSRPGVARSPGSGHERPISF
jgi:hypothetical protein